MLIFVCSLDNLILGFCYNNLTWETGEIELKSSKSLCKLWFKMLVRGINMKFASDFTNMGGI